MNILKHKVTAASISAKHVIIICSACCGSSDILEIEVLHDHSVRRTSSWAAIKIILLDIDTVCFDVADSDVVVCDVGDEASGVVVGLDARSVCGVDDHDVGEL